jgi:protease-4
MMNKLMAKMTFSHIKRVSLEILVFIRNLIADFPGKKPEYIVISLSGNYPVRKPKRNLVDSILRVTKKKPSLEELSKDVDKLASATWLKGVIIRLGSLKIDYAKSYMLFLEISKLKKSKKKIIVYAESLNLQSYYIASLADRIVLPESADLMLTGISIDMLYKKDFLDRFGISFQKLSIKEYKSAGDDLALSSMTKANEEQINALLDSFTSDYSETISKGRNTDSETVKAWINKAVKSADKAKSLGMIDELMYEDELFKQDCKELNKAKRFLKYPRPSGEDKVAVITLNGMIVTGKSKHSPFPIPIFGQTVAGSDTVIADFRAAEADERTKAIVFYVDSGGGSPLASDLIWREVIRIKKTKPVIAVMGLLAGSGGYYVLAGADKIIATPGTITGSIGVLTGKVVLNEFYKKQSLNMESIKRGQFADTFSSFKLFTSEEEKMLNEYMYEVYNRFVDRVASGRGLSKDRVNEIGKGRIWSGNDALDINLIDEIGDIQLGIQRAKELAKLPPNAAVYNISTKGEFVLPKIDNVETFIKTINPLLQEQALLISEFSFSPFSSRYS